VTISAAEQAVLDRIDESLLVQLTQKLLQATGQNPPGEEAATVAALSAAGIELGLDVVADRVEPGRDNLSITLAGGNGPGLLLLGHTDVVPIGDGWTKDPFGGSVRDGRIYGRGASDMKGGLAARPRRPGRPPRRRTQRTHRAGGTGGRGGDGQGHPLVRRVRGSLVPRLHHRGADGPPDRHRRSR
jgi:hypothetical protein